MSILAATQIAKPADEQAFERASVVLWRGILRDQSVQRNGRRGQRQNGVDIFGIRDGDATWNVGIQCKLKTDGHVLAEEEVRQEVRKARTFKPALREYFITTTAPDDVAMQELAREITSEIANEGGNLRVLIWGWNTLEERISEDAAARRAFDPTFDPFSEQILSATEKISITQSVMSAEIASGFLRIEKLYADGSSQNIIPPGDSTIGLSNLEKHLDAEIDEYRNLNTTGKSATALDLLDRLLVRVEETASARIRFRIKANIGHCLFSLGEEEKAAAKLLEAYDFAPEEPKAIANRAFALLLQGKWQEVLSLGRSQLEIDPENDSLAAYVVQAARFDTSINDPLCLVPDVVRDKATVQVAFVDFLRHRGAAGAWWSAAAEVARKYSDDSNAIQFAAEAVLDELCASPQYQRTQSLSATDTTRLENAVAALRAQWNSAKVAEGGPRPRDLAACVNLVAGLWVLGLASEALVIVNEGLDVAPNDPDIALRAAFIGFEIGDQALTQAMLAKLPRSAESVVFRIRYHASCAEWREVIHLADAEFELIPEVDRQVIVATKKLSEVKLVEGDIAERRQRIAAVAEESVDDPRASIVTSDFARREGLEDIAAEAFKAAIACINEGSHASDRQMVAREAARRGEWVVVADLLDQHIPETYDNKELRTLATALVNELPVRRRALAFFERLPDSVKELSFFQLAFGILHFNRGALADAELAFRRSLALQFEIETCLALVSLLLRTGKEEDVAPIVDPIDLEAIQGSPQQKMHLAQVLRRVGRGEKALKFAYSVLQSSKNDPQAALLYFGLVMANPEDGLIPIVSNVAIDTWVQLHDDFGQINEFTIEIGEDRPAEGFLNPDHPMAGLAIGHSIGDEFEVVSSIGVARKWHVREVKHKYLHALHDVMENFETRFPNVEGLYKIQIADGDIAPILDQVRRTAEGNQQLIDLYRVNHLPISFIAARSKNDVIVLCEYIRENNRYIFTCDGTEPERVTAYQNIHRHRNRGVVLDTSTAWTVASLDAFDVLKAIFNTVVVSRSTIDELRILKSRFELTAETSMSFAYRNGEFHAEEISANDREERSRHIEEQIAQIEAACDVQPIALLEQPSELARFIHQTFGPHTLDPGHLAGDEQLLISEDMYFRRYAAAACGCDGAWLQVVLWYAWREGMLDASRYVELLIQLAYRRHSYIALDATVLITALDANQDGTLRGFAALAEYIGTPTADLESHITVVVTYMNAIAPRIEALDIHAMRSAGIMLESLIRHRKTRWATTIALVKRGCVTTINKYIDGWVIGHFLPVSALSMAQFEIEQMESLLQQRTVQVPSLGRSGRKGARKK